MYNYTAIPILSILKRIKTLLLKTAVFVLPVLLVMLTLIASAQVNRANTKKSVPYKANYQRMTAGAYHSLEIRDGKLWACGKNDSGQLGDGTNVNKSSPIQVGTNNNWIAITAGNSYSFGLKSDGTLWAWGSNNYGQLGDGTVIDKSSPTQIGTDTKWVSITAGTYHSLGLKSDGTLWAWGNNSSGQLGDGTFNNKRIPVQIGTDNKWVSVEEGSNHSLGLKSDGTLWAWGANSVGQLGDGTSSQRNSPVRIGTDNKWISITAGSFHSLGVKSDGKIWAWGQNNFGELGDGTTANKSSPIQIGIDNKWVSISAGYNQTFGLKSDGTLWAWGDNQFGQLGDGTIVNKNMPVQIGIDNKWVSIAAGAYHLIGLKSDGNLWAWGNNSSGELGDGTIINKSNPIQISVKLSVWLAISAGSHSLGLKSDGTLWAWGDNIFGQLGDGTSIPRSSPIQIGSDNKWISNAAGRDQSLGLKSDGSLWAWGFNQYGQLGDGTTIQKKIPVQIGFDNKWVSIATGNQHSIALKSNGTLWAWGDNTNGQLGDGTNAQRNSPLQIGSDTSWISILARGDNSFGVKSNGSLWAWGKNDFGQLGDGTTINKNVPVQIGTDDKWVYITKGAEHSLGLKSDGTLWAWGWNSVGQVGDGTTNNRSVPVQIGIDNKWVYVTAGAEHSLGLKSDGTLWAWGHNGYGQMGNGTTNNQTSPVQIGADNNWVSIVAGFYHSIGLKSDRSQFCVTGRNNYGQLGDCSTTDKLSFVCNSVVQSPIPHYPFNPSLNISNNGSTEWNYSGIYQTAQITGNFSGEVNDFLRSYTGINDTVQVPIRLHSDSAGVLKITDLNIQYLLADTIPPSFVNAKLVPNSLAINSTFAIRVKVNDNEKVDSVKAKFNNTTYNLNLVSIDSFEVSIVADTVGYFPVTITVSDINGLKRDTVLFVTVYSTSSDMEVLSSNISIQPAAIFTNDSIHLTAIVKNNGNLSISNGQVALVIDGVIKQTNLISLSPLAQVVVNFDWLAKLGEDTIVIKADPANLITEANENNNIGTQYLFVNDIYVPEILQASATPSPAYIGNQVIFKIKAIDSTGIASVIVNWQNQLITLAYNPVTTFYEGSVTAGVSGTSNAVITANDVNGFSSTATISISVFQKLPDLKIAGSDISFDPTVSPGGSTTIFTARVYNMGAADVANASLRFAVDGVTVSSQNISVLHDSSATASFTYPVNCGVHSFTVSIDTANTISEISEANNTATLSHQFCPNQVQYSLTTTAIPAVVALGSSIQVHASSLPVNTAATVNVVWNNQTLPMIYNSATASYIATFTPLQAGDYVVPVTMLDSNNVQVTGFTQFKVINSLPDISINKISPVSYPIIPNNTAPFNVQVSNNGSQNLLSVTVHFVVDGNIVDSTVIGSLIAFETVTVPFNWFAKSGAHNISSATDLYNQIAESSESNNTKSISVSLIDNQPPVIDVVQLSSPVYQGGMLDIECAILDNDQVTSVTGNFMGNSIVLALDSQSQTWKAKVNTPTSGTFTLGITAIDNSSLTAFSSTSVQVNVLTADLEILPQHIIYNHFDTVSKNATVIISNNGGTVAGNSKVHLLLDGTIIDSISISIGAGKIDTIIFPISAPVGFHTLTIKLDPYNTIVESNEGNNIASRDIFVPDLTPPPAPVITVNPSVWSANPNFAVTWSAVTDDNGAVTYERSLNGDSWINIGNTTSTNVFATLEGINYVYVRAKDSSGNVSEPGIGVISFDNTAPNAPMIAEYHCGTTWTTHESPYLEWINPGDVGSGIQFFEVSIDNKPPQNIGFKLNFHDSLISGIHTLKVRSTDYVGHQSAWSNLATVYIDLDNPAYPAITSLTHPNQNKWYQNDSLVLKWGRPTETSAVTGFFYMLSHDSTFYADQRAYWTGNDSLTITKIPSMDTSRIRIPDGIWYVSISAQDTVGHVSSSSNSYRFKLDKTPPFTIANNLDTVLACSYTFNLHAEDYYSGVANTYFRINGGNWVNDSIVTLNQSASNLVEFYSMDVAGNRERLDSIFVFLKSNFCYNIEDSICQGGNVIIVSGISGPNITYQWQEFKNNAFVNLIETGIYSGVMKDTLKLTNVPSSYNGSQYRCIFYGSNINYSNIHVLNIVNRWTGEVSAEWENTGNWSCRSIPDSNTNVIINRGSERYPQISSNAICWSLQLQTNVAILVKPGYKLDIVGKNK